MPFAAESARKQLPRYKPFDPPKRASDGFLMDAKARDVLAIIIRCQSVGKCS
jgi:hypothetical protein